MPEEEVEGAVLVTDDAEHAAWFARDLDAAAAFYLPRTPNGRGVADAWSACCRRRARGRASRRSLIVSGDEAAADPAVRDAGRARRAP